MYAFCEEFCSGKHKIEVPVICISSERFHPQVQGFDSWKTTNSIFTHCSEKKLVENVVIKNTGHMHQCDLMVVNTIDMHLMIMRKPTWKEPELYMLLSQLSLNFLANLDKEKKDKYFNQAPVKAFLEKMAEWLKFDLKLE